MLVVQPNKRITWEELFKHPINNYFEEKTKNALSDSLKLVKIKICLIFRTLFLE